MNKELCIKVGKWNNSILWCTIKKTSNQTLCSYFFVLWQTLLNIPYIYIYIYTFAFCYFITCPNFTVIKTNMLLSISNLVDTYKEKNTMSKVNSYQVLGEA